MVHSSGFTAMSATPCSSDDRKRPPFTSTVRMDTWIENMIQPMPKAQWL